MSGVSPPKPWERAAAGGSSLVTPMASNTQTSAGALATTSTAALSGAAPALPARPAALTSTANRPLATTTSALSPYNTGRYGSGAYGGASYGLGSYGSYGSYSSPYSRFGGGYGGMGGYGYGGMGGMGGYGYGGMGGMGGYGNPDDPSSLMRGMENSTAATFAMIESIVGAFGSFAQMLESTFMATHSSFFAMVSVAEQFGNLRTTLGQILGIFAVIRWVKVGFAKLTGRPLPASVGDLSPEAFANFGSAGSNHSGAGPARRRGPSKKPFVVFLLAVFGLPYLMGKLIRALASKQEEEDRKRQEAINAANGGVALDLADPMKKLDFCRVLYDFAPENPAVELDVKKGDLVAVLSKSDPLGNPSQWWKCRTRDSRVGYLPEPYLEAVMRNGHMVGAKITDGTGGSAPVSRTGTLTNASLKELNAANHTATSVSGLGTGEQRTMSLTSGFTGTKPGDISIESFQKSGFYN